MIKKLTKHGNSHALVIDRTIMDQLGITPDSRLQITVTGDGILIRPLDVGIGSERVEEIMGDIQGRYRKTLDRLAE